MIRYFFEFWVVTTAAVFFWMQVIKKPEQLPWGLFGKRVVLAGVLCLVLIIMMSSLNVSGL